MFAKHDNCTCTVEYITDKYRENVHTKKRYALTPEQRQEILKNAPKPTRFTKEQAQNLQNNILNGVANSAESGIIKSGSAVVTLENQRYGRNKNTLVNKTYIDSGDYRRKFDNATDNSAVNKTLYDCAKAALKHRSGTKLEDMYWIDGNTGKIVLAVTDSTEERAIIYTDKIRNIISISHSMVTIHTHPSSMPPSASDLNSCFNNN